MNKAVVRTTFAQHKFCCENDPHPSGFYDQQVVVPQPFRWSVCRSSGGAAAWEGEGAGKWGGGGDWGLVEWEWSAESPGPRCLSALITSPLCHSPPATPTPIPASPHIQGQQSAPHPTQPILTADKTPSADMDHPLLWLPSLQRSRSPRGG